jgi:probable blue pigment (indigoidine) exporter
MNATSPLGASSAGTVPGQSTPNSPIVAAAAPLLLAVGWILTDLLPHVPLWIAVARVVPAGAVLLIWRPGLPSVVWCVRSIILGSLNFSGFFALQAMAVHHIPAGIAATISACQTLLVPLGSAVLLRTRVRLTQAVVAMVGILGVALLCARSSGHLPAIGICAAAGTAVCNTMGLLLTRRWGRPPGVSPLTATGWQMAAGGLVLLPVAIIVEGSVPPLRGSSLVIIAVLVIATAAAFAVLFGQLHAGLPATVIARLMLLCPLAVCLVGWLFRADVLTVRQMIGGFLILAPILLSGRWRGGTATVDDQKEAAPHPRTRTGDSQGTGSAQ